MQPRPLMLERFGIGDQFHPEWPHHEATPALPRTASPGLDSLEIGHQLPHSPLVQPSQHIGA
jgi:hypothetical protein